MKSVIPLLFLGCLLWLLTPGKVHGQECEYWSVPDSLSDSQSDNYDPFLVSVVQDYDAVYYVFWVRFLEVFGTEIVYKDYYGQQGVESVLLAEGYSVSEPQVISLASISYPYTDTLAFVFYHTNQNESDDIYYLIFTEDGFSDPVPFLNSPADETHLRVSQDGSMVWEEDGTIKYCQLGRGPSGFYFTEPVIVDEGNCFHPDINKHASEFIAWEKGNPDAPEIWHSQWDYSNQGWGEPELIFDDGRHHNFKFSRGMEDMGMMSSVLLSDYIDSTGQYHFSYYDLWGEWDNISEFSQSFPMEPELFTIDIITDFFGIGNLAFTHDEGMGNRDIYCSDYMDVTPWFSSYCRVDSTPYSEGRPVLFQGEWFFDGFDLVCIWESGRNGHSQLWTSTTPVIIGKIPDDNKDDEMKVIVFPNPLRDNTQFEFFLPGQDQVKLQIFNQFGQEVAVPVNGSLNQGRNKIAWNSGTLTPGLYYYRLSASGQRQTANGKIIIAR